jgi:hypothetical protein
MPVTTALAGDKVPVIVAIVIESDRIGIDMGVRDDVLVVLPHQSGFSVVASMEVRFDPP